MARLCPAAGSLQASTSGVSRTNTVVWQIDQTWEQLGVPSDVKGVAVSDVKDGSPAEAAGIQAGDVITKVIRDRKFQPLSTVQEFQEAASKTDELALYVQSGKAGRLVVLSKNAK